MSHQTTIQQFRLLDDGNVRLNTPQREDTEGLELLCWKRCREKKES
ncbi:hypothetical protein MtrunA17_Chr3g0100341 [Medicago truncatula]|uniref:Uncharacterized protein n=1 Tax=Medicago truncatula TaxID=3880 RepID=A0A396IWA1_MEDTR|nr:hypothetical protein MtrunA17_Chr3g0100341 [Medicago truncatula]